jgi:hypothetical protein
MVLLLAERRHYVLVSYLASRLQEHLVVFAERDAKDDGSNGLKTMNPLFTLGSLA